MRFDILKILSAWAPFGLGSTDRYWVNSTGDGDFNNADNWASHDGGSGGAGVPGTRNVAIFTSSVVDDCTLSANITLGGIDRRAGYTGTFDPAAFVMTVNNGAVYQSPIFGGSRIFGNTNTHE